MAPRIGLNLFCPSFISVSSEKLNNGTTINSRKSMTFLWHATLYHLRTRYVLLRSDLDDELFYSAVNTRLATPRRRSSGCEYPQSSGWRPARTGGLRLRTFEMAATGLRRIDAVMCVADHSSPRDTFSRPSPSPPPNGRVKACLKLAQRPKFRCKTRPCCQATF